MAKDKKSGPVATVLVTGEDFTATLTEIRERFRKLVIGSYFPQKKVVEFVAYLDGLIPKVKADNAAPKPESIERPATTAGAPLRPGYVGRDIAGDAGQSPSR